MICEQPRGRVTTVNFNEGLADMVGNGHDLCPPPFLIAQLVQDTCEREWRRSFVPIPEFTRVSLAKIWGVEFAEGTQRTGQRDLARVRCTHYKHPSRDKSGQDNTGLDAPRGGEEFPA